MAGLVTLIIVIFLVTGSLLFAGSKAVEELNAESRAAATCLKAGYPDHKGHSAAGFYCTNATSAVPIGEVQGR